VVGVRTELRDARPTRLRTTEREGQDAVWGVTGIMAETIVPDGPKQRRTRRRMRALRAMERLGLLGEENLLSTLAGRPDLRWLADERGARWAVLAELGRIGERAAFDKAVEWALETHPQPYEARAYVLGAGSRAQIRRSVGRRHGS
jgi:hypothetical protein